MKLKQAIIEQVKGPGGVGKLLNIALPLMISNACETVMMFTDRLFLSQLSSAHMAATMGGGLTVFMFATFFVGLIGYTTAMVAQKLGAGQKQLCPAVTTQALFICVIAYVFMLACIPIGRWIFHAAHIAPDQVVLQKQYFTLLMFASVVPLFRNTISNFFSGIGRTRLIMLSSAISMFCNIGLNYVLIFGKLGMPALGIRGAAYGTIIAGFLGLTVLLLAYFRKNNRKEFGIGKSFKFELPVMKELWRLGSPAGAELCLTLVAFNTLVILFHSKGIEVASAITIAFNWDMVAFVPLIGLNVGITSMVGRYVGAKSLDTVYRATRSGMVLACLYIIFLMALFFTIPTALVDLFRPDTGLDSWPAIRSSATYMVRIIGFYLFADAVRIVYSGALRGAGDTLWAMSIAIAMHWFLAAETFVLLRIFQLSADRSWLIVVMTLLILSMIYYLRYRFGNWQKKAMELVR